MSQNLHSDFEEAFQAFQAGDLTRAENKLKKLVGINPEYYDAVHLLGIICAIQLKYQEAIRYYKFAAELNSDDPLILNNLGSSLNAIGQNEEAILIYRRALEIDPTKPEIYFNLANTLCDLKKFEEALFFYEQSIKLDPKYFQSLNNYGRALYELKRHSESLMYYDHALLINPFFWDCLVNKGVILNELKRFDEALAHYDRALSLKPDYAEGWSNKAITLHELKRYEETIAHYDRALSLKPDYAEGWSNKGLTLHELKRYEEAIAHYDRALSLKPDYSGCWINKGNIFFELKRYEEAIAHYDRALSLKPDYAEGLSNKGNSLYKLKRHEEAIAHFDRALSLKPNYTEGWYNKGTVLNELKLHEEAIVHYEKAISLKPDIDWALGDLVHTKMKICNWSGLPESSVEISKKIVANEKVIFPFPLLALNDDPIQHKKSSEIYIQSKYLFNSALGPISKRQQSQKIRIAYFSADFRSHPVSFLTSELFEIHDRQRFEVFAFSLQKASDDEMNLRLRKVFDNFLDVDDMSDQDIAQLARKYELDIAIDLAGHTHNSRTGIFAYRVAPIQVNWLGYPGTLGADYMDYVIADKTLIPEAHQPFYVEKVAYLPNTFMVDDRRRIASPRIFTRQECGLPQNTFVFCCFNNEYKFNPQVLDLWSRIMHRVDQSVLWIPENNEKFKGNITAEFEKRGLNRSRLVFAKRLELMTDHLARYKLADLFLDTYPYNAHSTAVDSLKAGTPVLTMTGQSFASRVATSLLKAIDLPELITNSQAEYENLAVKLATNPQMLTIINEKLTKNRHTTPLFDTPLFTKHIETVYAQMYERYRAGLMPEHIRVDGDFK